MGSPYCVPLIQPLVYPSMDEYFLAMGMMCKAGTDSNAGNAPPCSGVGKPKQSCLHASPSCADAVAVGHGGLLRLEEDAGGERC